MVSGSSEHAVIVQKSPWTQPILISLVHGADSEAGKYIDSVEGATYGPSGTLVAPDQ